MRKNRAGEKSVRSLPLLTLLSLSHATEKIRNLGRILAFPLLSSGLKIYILPQNILSQCWQSTINRSVQTSDQVDWSQSGSGQCTSGMIYLKWEMRHLKSALTWRRTETYWMVNYSMNKTVSRYKKGPWSKIVIVSCSSIALSCGCGLSSTHFLNKIKQQWIIQEIC